MKPGQFDITTDGDKLNVKRHFTFGDNNCNSLDFDISYLPAGGKGNTTIGQMHQDTLILAIDFLQSLLRNAQAQSVSPTHPA